MPVRREASCIRQGREAIPIGVAEDVRQGRFRRAFGHEKEHPHTLGASGRRFATVVPPVLRRSCRTPMPTRPRHDRCQRNPRFEEKSRGKKYWCGAGNTATLPRPSSPRVFCADLDRWCSARNPVLKIVFIARPRCRNTKSRNACCCLACDWGALPCRARRRSSRRRRDRWW